MAEGRSVYAEDIVRNAQGELGLVLEDGEETTDDSSDSENEAHLKKGQILVCWYPSGNEETLSVSKVKLADRSLLPGDVVRLSDAGQGNQKGFVNDVEVLADVRIQGTNQVISKVDCRELEPLQEIIPSVHVAMGPWLGLITESYQKVILRLKNGSRCCLEGEQSSMLYDLGDQRDEDSPFYSVAFYPGQKVAGPPRAFKEAKWLSGTKPIIGNQTQLKAVVEQTVVTGCDVNWQVCGACNPSIPESNDALKPPRASVKEDELSKLNIVNYFRHASIQIGDKAFYTVKPCDVTEGNQVAKGSRKKRQEKESKQVNNSDRLQEPTVNAATSESATSLESQPEKTTETADYSATASAGSEQEKVHSDTLESDDSGANQPQPVASSGQTRPKLYVQTSKDSIASLASEPGDSHGEGFEHNPVAASDSGDADDDSDGGDTVVPRTKGTSSQKHDSAVRQLAPKRRRKRPRRKRKVLPLIKVKSGDRVCVELVCTYTTVGVVWQDGSEGNKILSTDLTPVFHLDELEFFPGDFVSDKREENHNKYGVVLTTKHDARLCSVKWFTREGLVLSIEDDVSVYDIAEHADFVYNPGDVAVRVTNSDTVQTDKEGESSNNVTPSTCIGQVTTVDTEGQVHIRWVDGTLSRIKPQELYKVDPGEDDHSHSGSEGGGDRSDDEWETASDVSSGEWEEFNEDDQPLFDNAHDPDLQLFINYALSGVQPLPQADQVSGDDADGDLSSRDEETQNVDNEVLRDANNRVNEVVSSSNPDAAFRMLENVPQSHAFKNSTLQPGNMRKFLSCVRKEMALLQTSLPHGIQVRGFEDRMDLLSVLIPGPAGTPYEHGLFVFDVQLPHDYPASPPVFHYLSNCSGRLNPNLYEDGKVCVSLLGTWAGRGNEVWTTKSNILQVLISIQGLILCREPYYNEAGYEKQRGTPEGQDNSRLYNEMVYVKLLQSIERLVGSPPAVFNREILDYYAKHGAQILEKFQSWIDNQKAFTSECLAVSTTVRDVTGSMDCHATCSSCNTEFAEPVMSGNTSDSISDSSEQQTDQAKSEKKFQEKGTDNPEKNKIDREMNKLDSKNTEQMADEAPSHKAVSAIKRPAENGDITESTGNEINNQSDKEGDITSQAANSGKFKIPDYPLFPLSKGFVSSLKRCIVNLRLAFEKQNLLASSSAGTTKATK